MKEQLALKEDLNGLRGDAEAVGLGVRTPNNGGYEDMLVTNMHGQSPAMYHAENRSGVVRGTLTTFEGSPANHVEREAQLQGASRRVVGGVERTRRGHQVTERPMTQEEAEEAARTAVARIRTDIQSRRAA